MGKMDCVLHAWHNKGLTPCPGCFPARSLDTAYDTPPLRFSLPKAEAASASLKPALPTDTQVGGTHYTRLAIQPMHYAMVNGFNALQFTVLKYISRYDAKGTPLQDLEKARHAIDMLIQHVKEEN